jgi:hypothetical protein
MVTVSDFEILNKGPVSAAFLQVGILSFVQAMDYVAHLPYRRIADKNNVVGVIHEGCGTCSSKHLALAALAKEQGHQEVKLVFWVFRMNAQNLPKSASILKKYQLDYLPEVHVCLDINGALHDATWKGRALPAPEQDFMFAQFADTKLIYQVKKSLHHRCMEGFLKEHPMLPYRIEQLFTIREECIHALYDS